jgi:hypothetical protein
VTSSASGFETFSFLSKGSLEIKKQRKFICIYFKRISASPLSRFLELLKLCSVWDPAKIFFTSKFSYLLLFFNLTHKTETGTADR